ncbi:bile acid:sodium symporter family protein [Acidipropionibacterium thoenii]|uniref:bile acid:sodium symporter family protein n=1 Tax=Acidipropionibacterium thoenii TaxID=1751 RepID=UPI00040251E0|nr:bile acid:sodium symporter family protein [Acidipropionibacterium thoenii]
MRINWFLVGIVAAAVIASIVPARGAAVPVVDWTVTVLVFLLFLLYGARLEPRETLQGLQHWRLHLTILACTFVVFPLVGIALRVLTPWAISPVLYLGLLWLTLVPSTVQSSINFTSIAHGNVPGAIVSATTSNLVGTFITPVLAFLLVSSGSGITISASSILDVLLQILLPFILGQLSRPLTARLVTEHGRPLKFVDNGVILAVVYSAFSSGVREHIWSMTSTAQLGVTILICLLLLALMLWLSWALGGWLRFNRPDRIAIQFCGTKKSLATGLPMAAVLFTGQPVGLIVLPLMIFHMCQLIACGWIAGRYRREWEADQLSSGHPAG